MAKGSRNAQEMIITQASNHLLNEQWALLAVNGMRAPLCAPARPAVTRVPLKIGSRLEPPEAR